MARHPTQRLLQKAAFPTYERIRRDHKKAPPQIRPLLAYLEENLFDPELDATRLRKACQIRDNTIPITFHKVVSLPPYAYIESCRMEVACRLLRDTDLKIWQVGQLVGYSTLQVFSRAFDRWSGLRPSAFRRRSQKVSEATPLGDGSREMSWISVDLLLKAIEGNLQKHEADELSRLLAELYPESFLPA